MAAAPLERPETPPSPLSTVPFARDRDFVSRDILRRQIHEKSSFPGSRIALVGLGGVGKSQLAIEYTYQIRSQSPTTWVLWVHASNEARFEESFREIADQVKIPGRQDPKANIFELVENWLRDEKKGEWVCVLDNADDDTFLCSPSTARRGVPTKGSPNTPTKALLDYIPRRQNGSIIITSRSREIALKMVNHKDIIELKPMEESEALELLRRTLDQPKESLGSQQLVHELEFMPLAIVQAGSLIRERGRHYSVSQYLREFQESEREAIRLLKKEPGYLNRDFEAKNSILLTWQISFDYLRHIKPSAADLLSLMSLFDRQGIPDKLIRLQPEASYTSSSELFADTGDEEISQFDESPELEDDITALRNCSFISICEDNSYFIMHRLVQLTTRMWLKSHGQINRWREKFISTLYLEFPTGEYENWWKCRSLFPHVQSAMSQRPESQESLLEWATLLYRGAWYASESGNIAVVRDMASKSRRERVNSKGGEDKEALSSTTMLARAYWLEGRWEEAEQLLLQVLEIRKSKLGVDHSDTLTTINNLASTFWNQGRWEEAEQLLIQVMQTSKEKLGVDHPSTLTSMANLASTYCNQGRWKDAEQLEVQVMQTRKTKLGLDHPDTLTSMGNLASTYANQGRWKERPSSLRCR